MGASSRSSISLVNPKSATICSATDCTAANARLTAKTPGRSAELYPRRMNPILGSKNPKTTVKSSGCIAVRKRKKTSSRRTTTASLLNKAQKTRRAARARRPSPRDGGTAAVIGAFSP